MKNMLRVAAVTPKVHIGSVSGNVREIMDIYEEYKDAADVIVTPELSITGYTCADLFENRKLIDGARRGLLQLAMATCTGQSALVVGLPFEVDGELFNCAAFLQGGRVVAIVPKTYLPNYGEFYEKRWFSARKYDAVMVNLMDPEDDGDELEYNAGSKKAGDRAVGSEVLFGNNVMIEMGSGEQRVKLGIEICEDAWTPVSPGRLLAMAGAEVILNLSASNEVIGKAAYRHKLIIQKHRCLELFRMNRSLDQSKIQMVFQYILLDHIGAVHIHVQIQFRIFLRKTADQLRQNA